MQLIVPDWPAPGNIRALAPIRHGGVSVDRCPSLNLGLHVGDDPAAVAETRRRLTAVVPGVPLWLRQVHGTRVLRGEDWIDPPPAAEIGADAAHAAAVDLPCAVMMADCLPVLFCDRAGTEVAAAHAGWRGLCAGVLENTVAAMRAEPDSLLAWLGPAIGPTKFEVGGEVREAFMAVDANAAAAFTALPSAGKFLADIYLLARQRLARAGLGRVYGGGYCTVSEEARFFSYRRDKTTGRMAALIWRTG